MLKPGYLHEQYNVNTKLWISEYMKKVEFSLVTLVSIYYKYVLNLKEKR